MDTIYTDIILQLSPYKDRVFYYGLPEDEVSAIETAIGNRFPGYFRDFLRTFGVRQDWVFGLFRKGADFMQQTDYLPKDIKEAYIVIGDNGGEDTWLLNSNDERDTTVYEWQYWLDGEVVSLGFDFKTLLKKSMANLSDPKTVRATNDQKYWRVQFAIPTNDEQLIYTTIPLIRTQDWGAAEISPVDVHTYQANARIDGREIELAKQTHEDWGAPIYWFDMKEPVSNFGRYSLIKELDTKLRQTFDNYRLVDYGILSSDEEMEDGN